MNVHQFSDLAGFLFGDPRNPSFLNDTGLAEDDLPVRFGVSRAPSYDQNALLVSQNSGLGRGVRVNRHGQFTATGGAANYVNENAQIADGETLYLLVGEDDAYEFEFVRPPRQVDVKIVDRGADVLLNYYNAIPRWKRQRLIDEWEAAHPDGSA